MSVSSNKPSKGKCVTPRQRRVILKQLIDESAATKKRLAEMLGVSRMTATRIAEQLLAEGLLQTKHTTDPISGRKSWVLTLADEPPLLLLDIDPNELSMSAYYFENHQLRQIRVPYRVSLNETDNQNILECMARQLWHNINKRPPRVVRYGDAHDSSHSDGQGIPTVNKSFAVSCGLSYFPKLSDERTVLHLQAGTAITTTLYVRETTDDPWFAVKGGQVTRYSAIDLSDNPTRICRDLLQLTENFHTFLTPDILLIELPQKYDMKPVPVSAMYKLLPIELPQDIMSSNHNKTRPQICLLRNGCPLWVLGVWDMLREERWTK